MENGYSSYHSSNKGLSSGEDGDLSHTSWIPAISNTIEEGLRPPVDWNITPFHAQTFYGSSACPEDFTAHVKGHVSLDSSGNPPFASHDHGSLPYYNQNQADSSSAWQDLNLPHLKRQSGVAAEEPTYIYNQADPPWSVYRSELPQTSELDMHGVFSTGREPPPDNWKRRLSLSNEQLFMDPVDHDVQVSQPSTGYESTAFSPPSPSTTLALGCVCNTCNKSFMRMSDLRKHEKVHWHAEDREHQCESCGAKFLYPKDVERHRRTAHPEDDTAGDSCPVAGCPRSEGGAPFFRKDKLQEHIKRLHPEHNSFPESALTEPSSELRWLECDICSATFHGRYAKGNLGRHRRVKHSLGLSHALHCDVEGCHKEFNRADARLKHHRRAHPERAQSPVPRKTRQFLFQDNET